MTPEEILAISGRAEALSTGYQRIAPREGADPDRTGAEIPARPAQVAQLADDVVRLLERVRELERRMKTALLVCDGCGVRETHPLDHFDNRLAGPLGHGLRPLGRVWCSLCQSGYYTSQREPAGFWGDP